MIWMLSFISVTFSLEKSKIILIKGTLTSKNIQLFIGLVESAKVNAIVTNDYYQAIVYHQKAWPQEDSSVPVEMFFFFTCYYVCSESVWHTLNVSNLVSYNYIKNLM